MAWSSVYTQLNTVLVANGFSASSTPIIFENPASITNNSYSIDYRVTRTWDEINNSYRSRQIANVVIRVATKLSAGDRMGSYNDFIVVVEDLIKDLENTSNWATSTSSINYIRFMNNNMNLDKQNYIVVSDIEIEITHTV